MYERHLIRLTCNFRLKKNNQLNILIVSAHLILSATVKVYLITEVFFNLVKQFFNKEKIGEYFYNFTEYIEFIFRLQRHAIRFSYRMWSIISGSLFSLVVCILKLNHINYLADPPGVFRTCYTWRLSVPEKCNVRLNKCVLLKLHIEKVKSQWNTRIFTDYVDIFTQFIF